MKTALLILSGLLVISFTGCGGCPLPPEPGVVVQIKYIKQPIPKIEDKPKFFEYNVILININGDEYYAIPRVDGSVLGTNWLQYRDWAEQNYKILKSLKDEE